ncbi:hypothetical protein U9M48_001775 [Paspalum notatum var. saurae]|uniref:Uncharacterized protein n=1 Tax=Paspalum notatum var. saurae TaxID=547442 RepID=A0AAQ3PIS3_PASNO
MQEVWDLLSLSGEDPEVSSSEQSAEQVFFALSKEATIGSHGPRTMRIQGAIQSVPLLILVDSGMDWLELFSPMKIHWRQKWMAIPYKGSTAVLQGIMPSLPDQMVLQLCPLQEQPHTPKVPHCPEIAALLREFQDLFEPVNGLPPPRHDDHSIPLVEGARPVYIRPYRYPPALKDEIEA